MANRHTLHINCIEDFKNWLVNDGWSIELPKDYYEVIRATNGKKHFIAYKRLRDNLQHLSTSDKDSYVVRAYINSKKGR